MKYSPTAAVLLQPPGSRNQESRHIRLSVLKAAVLVLPQGRDSHRKHQWGWYFQTKLEEPPTTLVHGEERSITGSMTHLADSWLCEQYQGWGFWQDIIGRVNSGISYQMGKGRHVHCDIKMKSKSLTNCNSMSVVKCTIFSE
ncbi:hypothetical protein STEG23_017193 [Scotinomys teguina]